MWRIKLAYFFASFPLDILRSSFVSYATFLLTLDGDTYQVASFNETSMTLTLEEIDTQANGDTTVYNEELRFTKI